MKRYKEFINEGLLSAMTPKPEEDILKGLDKLDTLSKFEIITKYNLDKKLQPTDNEAKMILDKLGLDTLTDKIRTISYYGINYNIIKDELTNIDEGDLYEASYEALDRNPIDDTLSDIICSRFLGINEVMLIDVNDGDLLNYDKMKNKDDLLNTIFGHIRRVLEDEDDPILSKDVEEKLKELYIEDDIIKTKNYYNDNFFEHTKLIIIKNVNGKIKSQLNIPELFNK